jgi:hypothetical protein
VAIVREASSLHEGAGGEILLRKTSKTSSDVIELLERFWSCLGFVATFERDQTEATTANDE